MSEAKHTPIPWVFREAANLTRIWGPGSYPADYPVASCERIEETAEQHNANAQHIVRCVNSHDDLLAACKSLLAHCIDDLPVLPAEYQTAVDKARAAIAGAEEN